MNDFVHHTTALHPDVRDIQYREVRSFRALSEQMRRSFSRTGYVLAGVFALIALGEAVRGQLYPATVHDVIYLEHDRSTGWIGVATAAHDAPSTFTVKEAHAALSEYIWARERYLAPIQQVNEKRVQAMSSIAVWTDYVAWLRTKGSPKQALAASSGHIDIFGLTFSKPLDSPDGTTFTYAVRYNRREVKADSGSDATVTACDATIAFQWHPEMLQDEPAAQLNPYGIEVISYRQPECKA
jgi:type IV secretory pathway component VirB8